MVVSVTAIEEVHLVAFDCKFVVVRAAEQLVRAGSSVDGVVAGSAVEHVVARIASDQIITALAEDRVVGEGSLDAVIAVTRVDGRSEQIGDVRVKPPERDSVVAAACPDRDAGDRETFGDFVVDYECCHSRRCLPGPTQ